MRNKPTSKREPSFSACSLCHWRWLGPDLFYEMAFLWASTGEIPCFQIQPLLKWHATTKRHDFSPAYLASGVLQVSVPDQWIDSLFPEVRRVLEVVQTRNTRLQSGKQQAYDRASDRAAEGFLQTVFNCGICFWQNLPFKTQR